MNHLTSTFRFEFVRCKDYIPEELREGKFYYCEKYHTATHLCACGCKRKVVTPINYPGQPPERDGWDLHVTSDGLIDMRPSIGNFNLPCKSHYFIRSGLVQWC